MKIFFLHLVALITFPYDYIYYKDHIPILTDTVVIKHNLDGNIDEWPGQKFESDNETGIKYAVDNDAENLYIAMSIAGFPAQMKIMSQGMNLYIDVNGKKKEGKGIEYPVKNETSPGGSNSNNKNFDKQAIRSAMVMNLIYLKLFGFTEGEPLKQSIEEGSLNIGFAWDSADIMNIEYKIPLSMLAEKSLDKENISVGWKINSQETRMGEMRTSEIRVVSVQAGRGPSGRSGGGRSRTAKPNPGSQKEHSFWTKYTISVSSK